MFHSERGFRQDKNNTSSKYAIKALKNCHNPNIDYDIKQKFY